MRVITGKCCLFMRVIIDKGFLFYTMEASMGNGDIFHGLSTPLEGDVFSSTPDRLYFPAPKETGSYFYS